MKGVESNYVCITFNGQNGNWSVPILSSGLYNYVLPVVLVLTFRKFGEVLLELLVDNFPLKCDFNFIYLFKDTEIC